MRLLASMKDLREQRRNALPSSPQRFLAAEGVATIQSIIKRKHKIINYISEYTKQNTSYTLISLLEMFIETKTRNEPMKQSKKYYTQ